MKFWDSSALVPLIVTESSTATLVREYDADSAVIVWWGTEIECVSAICRRERTAKPKDRPEGAFERLDDLRADWIEIEPGEPVRRTARRLLRTHPLIAADALQLAAAIAAAEDSPERVELVTLDEQLAVAARREGFRVAPQQQV